jgi:hypothetical protein
VSSPSVTLSIYHVDSYRTTKSAILNLGVGTISAILANSHDLEQGGLGRHREEGRRPFYGFLKCWTPLHPYTSIASKSEFVFCMVAERCMPRRYDEDHFESLMQAIHNKGSKEYADQQHICLSLLARIQTIMVPEFPIDKISA